ncbi:hypothetical protein MPTK1_7g02500 [Marchantia polymorpha subsp. ruderalis]|uniref:Leucine-rich repeat-containing N-terminal plant-type domain-containing protein n=2 Tax=Marchantia polymorpha TaxID=3197 RepID=A0A176WNX8_MARPO|nr:hypothetical protein AXG93_3235s1060 [Marchantia polymorpha subsp. ruderalis]PTQ33490.1 hypothetical protein MARPO_0088s0036 [Marchantia polymorpha]BBN15980.1 hypothetical protein Mp_7g02500 [Marchantia polymorpha subsp. ruderalis]|eukprot:PTQ33490.1 hypothetical protein MARPO_0088s0036 [Marchantia polymorpha]
MDSRCRSLQLAGVLCILAFVFSSASAQTCIKRDRDALLAFKARFDDPLNQLGSWNQSRNCCKDFVGVTCNSKGEVTNLTFAGRVDEECDEDCPFIRNKNEGTDPIGPTLSKLLALQTLNLSFIQIVGPFPSGLSALKSLSYLSLTRLELQGSLPADLYKISSLKYLAFGGPFGGFTSDFCKLTKLEIFDISETVFSAGGNGAGLGGTIPSCIGDLQQLRQFLIEFNNFTGPIPDSIRRLQKLQQLKLSGNALSGPIPAVLGELKALEILYIQGNDFSGSIPSTLGNLPNLKDLRIGGTAALQDNSFVDLKFTNIDGAIPSSLGGLPKLQTLYIKGSRITGAIPSSLGNAKMLTDLELEFNSLDGVLPASLAGLNLTVFQFNDNQISGVIPAAYGQFRFLTRFIGTRNKLTGPLPKELSNWRFQPAGALDLSDNMITGPIPDDLGLALPLADFNISYNQLSGSLKPSSWYKTSRIYLNNNQLTGLGSGNIPDDGESGQNTQTFDVHSNRISGPVPNWVFQFVSASAIDLSDNMFTALPVMPSAGISVYYLNVSNNQITGSIPDTFSRSNDLDMSRNKLTGSIPASFGSNNANIIDLSYNMLTGEIPAGIYDGTFFNTLVLSNNMLTGPIPERSDNNVFLRNIDVSNNLLIGSVPASLFNSTFSGVIKVGNNRLTGPVPNFADNCDFLTTVVLENNLLSGPVLPSGASFETCNRLEVFDVSGNNLSGGVPTELANLLGLRVLDLSMNSLTGPVNEALSSLASVLVLDLSGNRLTGSVPWTMLVSGFAALKEAGASALKFMSGSPAYSVTISYEELSPGTFLRTDFVTSAYSTALNFSNNALAGIVDSSVGQLKGLHAFDISGNQFSGAVPETLADITDLDFLDVSYNNFRGPISPKLATFPASSFEGNPNLCGAPLSNPCT